MTAAVLSVSGSVPEERDEMMMLVVRQAGFKECGSQAVVFDFVMWSM